MRLSVACGSPLCDMSYNCTSHTQSMWYVSSNLRPEAVLISGYNGTHPDGLNHLGEYVDMGDDDDDV